MEKLSKIVLMFCFLIIFSSLAYAVDSNETLKPFKVTIAPIKDRIDFEENAQFKITIENPRDTVETFNIKPAAPYVEWFIKTDPVSDYSVKVYPETKREVMLIAKPLSVGIGRFALRINIENQKTKDLFQKDIIINVVSMSNVPAVSISAKVPQKIDPREPFAVTVWLENRNAKILQDVSVELKSDVISESTKTTLGSFGSLDGTKTLEFTIQLDNKTAPVKLDSLKVIVRVKDGNDVYELKSAPYDYEIIKYGNIFDNHNPRFRLFGKYDEVSFLNNANVRYDGIAKLESPFYRALFTRENPRAFSFVEDGKRYIVWNVSLEAQDKFDVVVSVNYLPLVVFVVALIIIIALYYGLRSPIVVTKSVRDISTRDGGITKFKIVLYVKNRSKRNVENLAIIDKIPDIADYEAGQEAGTLQPAKVVHTKKGVIAKWMISFLGSKEETVITYRIKSRLSVLGGMSLPIAISKFYEKNGNPKRSYSNRLRIRL